MVFKLHGMSTGVQSSEAVLSEVQSLFDTMNSLKVIEVNPSPCSGSLYENDAMWNSCKLFSCFDSKQTISTEQVRKLLKLKQCTKQRFEAIRVTDKNWNDLCGVCLQLNGSVLDLFLSKIGDQTIAGFIELITKSYVQTVIDQIFEQMDFVNSYSRKICVQCLKNLIELRSFLDIVRFANKVIVTSFKRTGQILVKFTPSTFHEMVEQCTLRTSNNGVITTEQFLNQLEKANQADLDYEIKETDDNATMGETVQTEIDQTLTSNSDMNNLARSFNGETETIISIFCSYCDQVICGRKIFDEHVLMHLYEEPDVDGRIETDHCENCLEVFPVKNSADLRGCLCKLRKYQNRIEEDIQLTFEEFSEKYFEETESKNRA